MTTSHDRRLLLIAFHFPPVQGSSGVHRILSFAKYLPNHAWRPTILTVKPHVYFKTNPENMQMVPEGTEIVRCSALDAHRHFSFKGRFPGFLAVPDRWRSWKWFGVRKGRRTIKRQRPRIIMSSFPIATANIIARELHRQTGIPWVADLRDPMVVENYPPEGTLRREYESIEKSTFEEASAILVATQGAAELYRRRYPDLAVGKLHVIENGFDEEIFEQVEANSIGLKNRTKLRILHSGLVYPEARNPAPLFLAVSELLSTGILTENEIEIAFRASGQDQFIAEEAKKHGLEKVVKNESSVNYLNAVRDMMQSDSLLILQSADCNNQIPAKAYEYLRCQRPILAITDPNGDTGRLLKSYGVADVAALEDIDKVRIAVKNHVQKLQKGAFEFSEIDDLSKLSRRARIDDVASILNQIENKGIS